MLTNGISEPNLNDKISFKFALLGRQVIARDYTEDAWRLLLKYIKLWSFNAYLCWLVSVGADNLHEGYTPRWRLHSVEVLLRNLTRIYARFEEVQRKFRAVKPMATTCFRTQLLLSTSFEGRIFRQLMGCCWSVIW